MKGQVTAEYLLVLLVSASLVGISVFALTNLNDKTTEATSLRSFESDADRIITIIREVCALGDGSVLTTKIFNEITIVDEGDTILLRGSGVSKRASFSCEVEEATFKDTVKVENNDRTIHISETPFQD